LPEFSEVEPLNRKNKYDDVCTKMEKGGMSPSFTGIYLNT